MAKKISAPQKLPLINCEGCKYIENDDGVIMWCSKIRMPIPSKSLKNCIHKLLK